MLASADGYFYIYNIPELGGDCEMVKHFISCPASLEEKYSMMRLSDLLKRNKKVGVNLETLSAAMSQLAKIGKLP